MTKKGGCEPEETKRRISNYLEASRECSCRINDAREGIAVETERSWRTKSERLLKKSMTGEPKELNRRNSNELKGSG